jgi:hypothetical protein
MKNKGDPDNSVVIRINELSFKQWSFINISTVWIGFIWLRIGTSGGLL